MTQQVIEAGDAATIEKAIEDAGYDVLQTS